MKADTLESLLLNKLHPLAKERYLSTRQQNKISKSLVTDCKTNLAQLSFCCISARQRRLENGKENLKYATFANEFCMKIHSLS